MPNLDSQLDLDKCPHCSVDKPNLKALGTQFDTYNFNNSIHRRWKNYGCARCGGVVLAGTDPTDRDFTITEMYPASKSLDEAIPKTAREYLTQAYNSIRAPAGAIMLAASSVDAMLKTQKYTGDGLVSRVEKAAENGIVPQDLVTWAHQVRLESNDDPGDAGFKMPTQKEARQVIDFALVLAEFMFVLPKKMKQGLKASK